MKKIMYIQKYNHSSIIHFDNGERKYVNVLPYLLVRSLRNDHYEDDSFKNKFKLPIQIKDNLLQPTCSIHNANCEFINMIRIEDVAMTKEGLFIFYPHLKIKLALSCKTFYKLQKMNYLIYIRLKWQRY